VKRETQYRSRSTRFARSLTFHISQLTETEGENAMVFIISVILLVVVMGWLDSRLRWPKPNDKTPRYVSIAERSSTLRPTKPGK
jgi:uncharacterized membrane protein